MTDAWRRRWQGFSRRERAMVVAAGLTVVAGLVVAFGIEPAWRDRARVAAALPALQSQRLEVEALAVQARDLRASGIGTDPGQSAPAAERSLGRAGVPAKIVPQPGGGFQVQARGVAAGPLLAWVETFSREARVRVVQARIERSSASGLVDADVWLAPGGR